MLNDTRGANFFFAKNGLHSFYSRQRIIAGLSMSPTDLVP
jgi:hypothetical protein